MSTYNRSSISPKPVDGNDVRIGQSRGDVRLSLKALSKLSVCRQVRRQNLQRHNSIRRGVIGPEHLAHPTFTEHLQQPIAAQRRSLHVLTSPRISTLWDSSI